MLFLKGRKVRQGCGSRKQYKRREVDRRSESGVHRAREDRGKGGCCVFCCIAIERRVLSGERRGVCTR